MKATVLLATLVLSVLTVPLASHAQLSDKVFRIGRLTLASPSTDDPDGFRQGLRELGYVEGQNIVIEYRSAEGNVDRLGALATDLVRRHMDVIVATGSPAIHAAQQATSTIPIVMTTDTDAVAQGFVVSLARPGGNITGRAGFGAELHGKRLEFLKQVVPTASRIAALWNPANASLAPYLRETQTAAQALGVELQVLEARTPNEFEGAFAAASGGRTEALIVMADAFLLDHRTRIVDLAQRHRLPGMYPRRSYVDIGGLMSYAADIPNQQRRAATYVDKILKGAKPADLPVEQPTKFELVINLKTAQTLGLTLPPHLLTLADQVIR
jgi:putative tryptophan/tyrosine transport system substrate-binding protein